MSKPVDPMLRARNALLDFALAVFDWHHLQDDESRQRSIDTTRVAGTHTEIAGLFEDFARQVEHDQQGDCR